VLTASPGSWSGSGTISYGYQWQDCGSYTSTINADHPAGYWRLGETGGAAKALDASPNSADGNYGGTVTLAQAGALIGDPDTAASFDGSTGFVEVPDMLALDPASQFTLEAWVKVSSAVSGTIIAKPFTVGQKQSYSLGLSAGKPTVTIDTTSGSYSATSASALSSGVWHLIDATYSANSLTVYVDNGAPVSVATSGSLQYSSLPLELGRFDATAGQYFNGSIDEAAVYGTALTTQIGAHWSAASAVSGVAPCTNIAGATASTYALVDGDVGKKVAVQVTATDSNGSTSLLSPSNVVFAGSSPIPTPPVNTVLPAISGSVQVGQALSADTGAWSGTQPITFTYQWQRCSPSCSNITGATSVSYVLQAADQGATIDVVVTGTNSVGNAPATSAQTIPVAAFPGVPSNTVLPSVSGPAKANSTLTASGGTWQGTAPISLAYQWQYSTDGGASWNAIVGATSTSFTIPSSGYTGDLLRVLVTATNAAGQAQAASAATAAVMSGAGPANTALPTVAGTFTVGQTLTANPGGWSGTAPISSGTSGRIAAPTTRRSRRTARPATGGSASSRAPRAQPM
jgi:hypothetical protein